MKLKSNHKFEIFCKDFKVKEGGEGTVTISGFANTTDKDRQGDVILEEAWTKGGLDNYLKNPIVLAYHNPEKPIGEVTDYGVNNKGLHVSAEISKAAGDVYTLVKEGVLKAFSVGFMVKDADYDTDTDIFVIRDLEMYELSVVSIPANADSIFSVSKSFETEKDFIEFKQKYKTPEVPEVKEKKVIKEKTKVEDDKVSLTPEELKALQDKAVAKALADIEAKRVKEEAIKATAITAGKTGAESLISELETRIAEKDASMSEALEGLRSELKEKAEEITAMNSSKMEFHNRESKDKVKQEEIDTAVLTSLIMGKGIHETEYAKELFTKAGVSDHLSAVTADWENLFSTSLYEDIQDKTIVEPLFNNKVNMTSRTMTFPWNPEAGYAEWILEGNYKDAATSTGAGTEEQDINDNTIKAEKLATKEYLGYEEEEDSIIALTPIIRNAVMRRMVRSSDQALLIADSGVTGDSGQVPTGFNGCSTLAGDINAGADYQYTQAGAFGDPITIADLQGTRRLMGAPGLMPGDLTYIVSQSIMFDLMEDPDFRTMDLVGDRATILRGQVGTINGSPVIVSDSFVTNAASTVQAVCLNTNNYLLGTLRGLMVERDKDIEFQRHVLVATRRFGFTEIVPAVAVSTKRQSFCANLVLAA